MKRPNSWGVLPCISTSFYSRRFLMSDIATTLLQATLKIKKTHETDKVPRNLIITISEKSG
jgi:hypothetical protein